MKKIILAIGVIALAACSSAPKDDEVVEQDTQAVEAATAEPQPEPEAQQAGTGDMSADTGEDMEGGFPDVEGTERSGATCKNGGDERLVSVIDTREGTCGVVYTKHGNKMTVAYAKHDMSFCDKVYDNIIGNLTNGGFDCGGAQPTATNDDSDSGEEEAGDE